MLSSLLSRIAWNTAIIAMGAAASDAATITAGTLKVKKGKVAVVNYSVIDQMTGLPVTATVTIIGGPTSAAAAKAAAIVAAFTVPGKIPSKDVVRSGATVNFLGYSTPTVLFNGTFEKDTLAMGFGPTDPTGPYLASLGYQFGSGSTALSGIDSDGTEATYAAEFGFADPVGGSVALSADLVFSNLASPTIASLLTTEYTILDGQLSAQAPHLAGDLTLDLADNSIDLAIPASALNGSVTIGSTDIALVTSGSSDFRTRAAAVGDDAARPCGARLCSLPAWRQG